VLHFFISKVQHYDYLLVLFFLLNLMDLESRMSIFSLIFCSLDTCILSICPYKWMKFIFHPSFPRHISWVLMSILQFLDLYLNTISIKFYRNNMLQLNFFLKDGATIYNDPFVDIVVNFCRKIWDKEKSNLRSFINLHNLCIVNLFKQGSMAFVMLIFEILLQERWRGHEMRL